jgi:glutaredoxin
MQNEIVETMNYAAWTRFAFAVALVSALLWSTGILQSDAANRKAVKRVDRTRTNVVGLVFFFSRDCPHCDRALDLLEAIKKDFPVKVKKYDIDNKADYELFIKLERIHSQGKFSVPLIMLGDSILIGENDIIANLEPTVRNLSKLGGAGFPYLGDSGEEPAKKITDCSDCRNRAKGKPPEIQEELKKIRIYIDGLLTPNP